MPISNQLLVAIHNTDDGEITLAKAASITASLDAALHVVRVVHETFADLTLHEVETREALKSAVLRNAEAEVLEMVAAWQADAPKTVSMSCSVIWQTRDWQVILAIAEKIDADMIIKSMASSTPGFIRTPSDWHLLRHSTCPVMLVTPINWTQRPNIVAAIDASHDEQPALCDSVLNAAQQLTEILRGELHVASAFPSVERWLGPISVAIDFNKVRDNVQKQTDRHIEAMTARLKITGAHAHSREGEPADVITGLCHSLDAQVLVVGTAQNTGPKMILLSNTAEQILQQARCDVLVVVAAPAEPEPEFQA